MIKKLKDYITDLPIELAGFIEMSIILSEMVLREHQHNAVIGCLSPTNISIEWDKKTARMTGSGEVNVTYQSPEQSGRINRVPDGRSDLYALGVILYELLTGQLPFLPERNEDWSTVHIRRAPRPLSNTGLERKELLQDILMKLLAKSPDDRYQSAYGLLDDLNRCREMLDNSGLLTPFEVGRLDKIRSLGLSDTWYGRSDAVERMEAGFQQAVQGLSVFTWVTGQEGVGKTTLVRRLQLNVVRRGGRFVEGKAEPFQKAAPYEPILQAMRQWVHQLWSEPAEVISQLKINLQAKFGREAWEIVSFLPEIQPLFGNEAEVPAALNDQNDGDRLGEWLPDLIRCMAECKPPLVLYIDNLEWTDHGTHAVLHSLVKHTVPGLFMIGAYRTEGEEPYSLGQLNPWLAERWRMYPEEQVALLPLNYADVSQYVSDALHEDSARIRLLARSVYDQTGGNPRRIRLLLKSWLQEKSLCFDEKRRRWSWDPEVIRQMGDLEANLHLMEASFTRLSDDTRELLAMAAAIGPVFRLSILTEACDITPDVAFNSLQEAEAEGIICREDEAENGEGQDRIYLFIHEFIHQMAYASDSECNSQRHRKIGQLLQRTSQKWSGDTILTAIDHLNLAASILSEQELRQLAEHNLQAGKKSLTEGRYAKGKEYAAKGLRLSMEAKEVESDSLNDQLRLLLAWTEYMNGDPERARFILSELNKNTKGMSRAERLSIWTPLVQFHAFVDNEAAVAFGKEALQAYGWKLREKSSLLSVGKEVMRTGFLLYRKRDKPYRLPDPLDEEYAELCLLLMQLFFPLLMHDAGALLDLYARFIRYGLKKGINQSLAVMIGEYELIMQRVLPSYVQAPPTAERAFLQIVDTSQYKNKHMFTFMNGMAKQMDKPSEAFAMLYKSMRQGLESGDKGFANLALITCLVTYTGDLYALKELLHYFEENMRQFGSDKTLEMVQIAGNYLTALQDKSLMERFVAIPKESSSIGSEQLDEDNYSYGCRLEVAYLSGNYQEALYWAKRARTNELSLDWIRIRKQRFYESLTLATIFFEKNEIERKQIRQEIRHQLRRMKSWRGFLGNTSSSYLLMKAEGERITGNPIAAVHKYIAAIGQARAEKYALMEGIACERLAICYREDLISRSGAMINMLDACSAFAEWGITFKVDQIRSRHADLLYYPVSKQQEGLILEEEIEDDRNRIVLPLQNTPAQAGEASEGEYELVRQLVDAASKRKQSGWMTNFLEAALRQSGADRGFLLSCREDGFAIEAGELKTSEKQMTSGLYAESVLYHTALTNKPIIVYDAMRSFWEKDYYIEARQPRSILCIPIAVPGERTSYLLYLENRQLPGVFTDRDVKVLELVATRMIYVKLLEDEVEAVSTVENPSSSAPNPGQAELIEPLTERENEILMNIAEGLSNREIADRLGIAETTVKTHASRIISKLGVKRRGQAVIRARELRLIE